MTSRTEPLGVLYSFSDRLGEAGIGMTAWHQITGLIGQGVRVYVHCPSCEKPIQGAVSVTETLKLGRWSLPLRRFGPYRPRMLHDRRVASALRRLAGEVHLVHCWPVASLQTLRAARELGIRTFLERPNAHTAFAYEVVAKEYQKLGLRVHPSHSHAFNAGHLKREQKEYALADRILCPSEFVAKTFLERGFRSEQIARHQYGFDPARFSFLPDSGRERDNGPFSVAFVGSCEPRKGLHYALDAWLSSGAADAGEFHICGRFIPEYREVVASQLAHPSIIEHGFVSNVSDVLRRCSALVLPSIEEGSALVTYEARACGCVLLVSEGAGARCEHMLDGLVHGIGDVEALRDHMARMARDGELLRRLRAESLKRLREQTWKYAASRLIDVYRACLDGSSVADDEASA